MTKAEAAELFPLPDLVTALRQYVVDNPVDDDALNGKTQEQAKVAALVWFDISIGMAGKAENPYEMFQLISGQLINRLIDGNVSGILTDWCSQQRRIIPLFVKGAE